MSSTNITLRKPTVADAQKISDLINYFAKKEIMLPRSLNDTYECLRDFIICEHQGDLIGCVALHVVWGGLGEIRSLVVQEDMQKKGIGKQLVQACFEEANQLNIKKMFVLTYVTDFFQRFGFQKHSKDDLPQKVWKDCVNCPKFPHCDETAMFLDMG